MFHWPRIILWVSQERILKASPPLKKKPLQPPKPLLSFAGSKNIPETGVLRHLPEVSFERVPLPNVWLQIPWALQHQSAHHVCGLEQHQATAVSLFSLKWREKCLWILIIYCSVSWESIRCSRSKQLAAATRGCRTLWSYRLQRKALLLSDVTAAFRCQPSVDWSLCFASPCSGCVRRLATPAPPPCPHWRLGVRESPCHGFQGNRIF